MIILKVHNYDIFCCYLCLFYGHSVKGVNLAISKIVAGLSHHFPLATFSVKVVKYDLKMRTFEKKYISKN